MEVNLRNYPFSYSLATEQLKSVAIQFLLICFLMTLTVMHVGFVSALLGTRASLLRTRCEKIVVYTKRTLHIDVARFANSFGIH